MCSATRAVAACTVGAGETYSSEAVAAFIANVGGTHSSTAVVAAHKERVAECTRLLERILRASLRWSRRSICVGETYRDRARLAKRQRLRRQVNKNQHG